MKQLKQDVKIMPDVNYYVFARNGQAIKAVNLVGTNQVDFRKSEEADYSVSTSVLALEAINGILQAITKKKSEGFVIAEPIKIRTVNTLVQSINTGNFKYWIRTGAYANGSKLSEREINAWKEFTNLYAGLFADVNFNMQSISRRYRTKENNMERQLISTLWNELPKESVLENIDENIIF